MKMIGLDFETYGSVDLTKHGLDRYISDPHFRPLIARSVYNAGSHYEFARFDFVKDYKHDRAMLIEEIGDNLIVAHNAGFEQAVLAWMGIPLPSHRFIDSAVLARAAGAAGKLEAAGPQLLGMDKVETGWDLIKLFSIPGEYQERNGNGAFDPQIVEDNPAKWEDFDYYCGVDATLGLKLAEQFMVSDKELANTAVTMDMNKVGWHVDLDLVLEMQRQYLANVQGAVDAFRQVCNEPDLNLNSTTQMIEWCSKRGVRATSFDEAHVERMLRSVVKKVATLPEGDKRAALFEVRLLLETKQVMGGSSLKKLQTIIDTTGSDDRLHDQYLHIGAGATYRTTGRGVQMQNLKRLGGAGDDMELLFEPAVQWPNDQLARNLRQVFTATDPYGFLIVGDFSSVESRGLAWQANEKWKLDAYHQGKDLYKVQAGKIYGKHEAHVTKAERQVGKVGELACGYGAGPGAVKDFAAKMGVEMSEVEAGKLVRDWRGANPKIVGYWNLLNDALHMALESGRRQGVFMDNVVIEIIPRPAPQSLRTQTDNPHLKSLWIGMGVDGVEIFNRIIHGTHIKHGNICYWKPSDRKTGDLWTDFWVNPKTKQKQAWTVYGGKLAGLLTQSLCREVFFDSLRKVHEWVSNTPGVEIVGQFHDEIVLEWTPDPMGPTLGQAMQLLTDCMSSTVLPGFPLAADIKSDYRYTK